MKILTRISLAVLMTGLGGSLLAQGDQFPTVSYLSLRQDVLIEADLWRETPEILSANYGFEGIIGIPQGESWVLAAGGTWIEMPTELIDTASYRSFTSAATPIGIAANYGYPVYQVDAMPIVFSWPVLPSTVDASDFRIHLNTGEIVTPLVASIYPNYEYNERNTVVVFGEFGNRLPKDDPNAVYIVRTEIVADATPLMLVGKEGPVSIVGQEKESSHPYYDNGPSLVGAKLNHFSTKGEGGPALVPGPFPNDGEALYGADAQFRLRILTTGGFSENGVSSVLPNEFEKFFRLHLSDGEVSHLLTETGVEYRFSMGSITIVGLADLGLAEALDPYNLAYDEDHDNYIDIILKGDEAAMRLITHIEIPAGDGYFPFYNPGGPGNNPQDGVLYTLPGPQVLQPVMMALDDPMTVTYAPVPEPSTLALWGGGVVLWLLVRRRPRV